MASILRDIPFLDGEGLLNRVESDDFLEEIERVVAEGRLREVGDLSVARPRDDRNEQDAENDGALDSVQHEHDGQNTTTEYADPHRWVAHLVRSRANTGFVHKLLLASRKLERC